jgi:glycosyltransferase involved in cell wall biosynthesis
LTGSNRAAPKRILYVEQNEDGTIGGSHRILADLVTRLSPEYEPVVVFYQDNAWVHRLQTAGLEVHAWDERRAEEASRRRTGAAGQLGDLATQIRFRRAFLREARIDAVHLNNAPFVGPDIWIPACRLAGIPCMTYAMGYGPPESAAQRWLQRRYDLVFSLSRAVGDDLDRIGIPRSRRVMIHPGIEIEAERARVTRPARETRRELGIPDTHVFALMVGNIREWKGQRLVVEAISRLPDDLRRQLSLVLVGEAGSSMEHAEYGDHLRSDLTELGLEDTVSLIGRRDDVPDLFEAADIAIHASTIPEPFGMVVLEAMVHGCAVIASDSGGPAEILAPGAGHMFDPRDPGRLASLLADLVTDPERRAAMGRSARERAGEFGIGRHVREVEAGYRRVLRG